MYCLDANVFIESWKSDYPPDIFLKLWEKIADYKEQLILIEPIYKQIQEPKELYSYLQEKNFCKESIHDETEKKALELEKKYETTSLTKGADHNDILLISYAMLHDKTVVTLEAQQLNEPNKKSNYKIPLICKKENLICINFIDLLRNLKIKI